MNRILFICLFSLIIFSCKKDGKICDSPNACKGKHDYHLPTNIKNLVIVKDTVYIFKSPAGDSIKIKYRRTVFKTYKTYYPCPCKGPDTDLSDEWSFGSYIFENTNIGCEYHARTYDSDLKYLFEIHFTDTNALFDAAPVANGNYPHASFWLYDAGAKANDLDSINLNGKYYYNIIKNYDSSGSTDNMFITECYYSKRFGIVRFKYLNKYYDMIY
jgi:hypothetical protein